MAFDEVEKFWQRFTADHLVDDHRFKVVFFGDSAAMADELADLIIGGRKRATAGLYRAFVDDNLATPKPGDYFVVVDGRGIPQCICRTREVRFGALISVDDRFAFDEGEGDRSREYWLAEHRAFFGRAAIEGRFTMNDAIKTVFERFIVVWPTEMVDAEK